jgi:acyl-ACP thioesterase
MMIGAETHEFIKPSDTDVYKKVERLREDENPAPERIRLKTATRDTVYRTPVYSDIDMNRHMNNARYAEWVCDLFSTETFAKKALKKLQINYVSDGIEGHEIALDVEENRENDTFIVKGLDRKTEKIVFESAGEWMDDGSA